MTRVFNFLGIFVVAFGMSLAAVDDADARRLGGARTLGGKSTFQRSARPAKTPSQQAAFNTNQQARQKLAQRGGMMGMLGGLALGGLLGALFFGGAFENINLLDMLLFGGVAFLLFRLFAARQRAPIQARQAGPPGDAAAAEAPGGPGRLLFGGLGATASGEREPTLRPAGFDERAFLAGARRAFETLQKCWNDGNLGEIRGLTTERMFAELQDQFREPDAEAFVQVLKVEAELIDVQDSGETQEAAVLFDSILRESESQRPSQVREIWHFTRPAGAQSPTWYLDGIEQMQE